MQFRAGAELAWAVVGAVAVAAAQLAADFQPEEISDWRFWIVVAVGGLVRAAGAGLLVGLAKLGFGRGGS